MFAAHADGAHSVQGDDHPYEDAELDAAPEGRLQDARLPVRCAGRLPHRCVFGLARRCQLGVVMTLHALSQVCSRADACQLRSQC